jgi:hypothetical protein
MTQQKLIPSNLPLYFQCLRAPCEVGTGAHSRWAKLTALQQLREAKTPERATRVYWLPKVGAQVDSYDPWEQRGRFFQIKEDDDGALVEFLATVGFFKSSDFGNASEEETMLLASADGLRHSARYSSEETLESIWATRRLIENSLRNLNKHTGGLIDFTARIILVKGKPRVTITTCNFLDSLLLTLAVDKVQKSKVRRCSRPDCGIPYSSASAHNRKFCTWYCGHIESVRKQRREAKISKKEL